MSKSLVKKRVAAAAAVCVLGTAAVWAGSGDTPAAPPADISKLALQTVTAERVQRIDWEQGFTANGSIAAWHEAVVGSELGGLRLAQVDVNVGDRVTRGQVLARLFSDGVAAELVQQQGALEEARAALAEAQENAAGARTLLSSGAMSTQQSTQYLTQERSARARVTSAEARVKIEQIRLAQTAIVAQDDGIISARSATVGAVAGQGQELFRLIRQGRLEWRAEVSANELNRIKPGQVATLRATNGATLQGHVRAVAPSVDPQSRNALVYVDLPANSAVRAGMFASGQFALGSSPALTLPQGAVVTRDGISYVFAIGANGRVAQTRVETGRRSGDRIELLGGVKPDALLVNQGAGFLTDGDMVRVAGAMSSSTARAADTARTSPVLAAK